MTAVLAIADCTEAEVDLRSYDVVDSFVFERFELVGGFVFFVACIEEVLGPF